MSEAKVALVTGGSSGIGLAVARRFVARGVRVALVARTRKKLDEVVAELGAERAAAFALDVSDLAALERLPEQVIARFGALDYVINNAGVNHRGPILSHGAQALAEIITTNLTAPVVLTRAAAERLRPGGAVVNVASLAGYLPYPGGASYSASKMGLRAFARAVDEELAHRGVRVCTVSPGPVDTPFFGDDIAQVPSIVFSQPMSTADEVADAVLRCIDEGVQEIALPRVSGLLATVGFLFPGLARRLRPMMERRGERNKQRYASRKR